MSLDVMAATRQAGERLRVDAFKALVDAVKGAPSDRYKLIAHTVEAAKYLSEKSKATFRGQCKRVTHPRAMPIFDDALRFSERVIAERFIRDPKMPTVQHVLLDVCKRVIDRSCRPPQQVLTELQASYQTSGSYPPD